MSALIGLTIIVVNVLAAGFAPWIAPHGEAELVGEVWARPGAGAWFGLDNLGRDIFSRVIFGTRTTIGIALITTLVSFTVGIVVGFTAAIAGGWVDMLLARFVDAVMAIPTLIFALVILSVMGTSIPVLIGTIALISSTRVFRLSRALAMNIVALEYVEAARLRGETWWWIVRREVLPNAMAPLVAEFGVRFCFTVLFVASLSFLGLGIQPPRADWGSMVGENAPGIAVGSVAPLVSAAAIAVLTVGVNLVADWFLAGRRHVEGVGG